MPDDNRPLYVLHIAAERVSSEYDPFTGFSALVVVPLATSDDPEREPLRIPVALTPAQVSAIADEPENLAGSLDGYCSTAADRAVRAILAGEALPSAVSVGLKPRVPHAARAAALAKNMQTRAKEFEAELGPDWMRIMLESAVREVFMDGEAKGYQIQAHEQSAQAELGAWFETELRPRLRGDIPKPGDSLDTKVFHVRAEVEE